MSGERWTSKAQQKGRGTDSGQGHGWVAMGASPVGEVQNGLDRVPTTCSDVTLETRQQRQKHVDSEALPLSGEGGGVRGGARPKPRPFWV